jgi:tRNA-uridine 2-sulfurtransferase
LARHPPSRPNSTVVHSMMNSLDLPKEPSKTRVVVAMSGGVDSSVVAALLKHQGYEVIGVTMQLYDHGEMTHRPGSCCAGQDIHDARRVAEAIGIPHYVLDYENRFKAEVMDRFAESYLNGETPVPCIECNRTVKFRDLLGLAAELEADVMATGHYVLDKALEDGRRGLFRAADANRDQSYFLYGTTQGQLERLRFPLGGLEKSQVRELANELGLAVADKPDSQDICFVPNGNYAEVIEKLKPGAARPGDIRHLDGRVMGRHEGVLRFTVGQRKGIGIAAAEALYVIRIDADTAEVIIGPREALATQRFMLRDLNWLGDVPAQEWPNEGLEVAVRVRSTRPPRAAIITSTDDGIAVMLTEPEQGVSPGQACVIYAGDADGARVLGGGIIRASARVPFGQMAGAPALATTHAPAA